MSACAQSIPNEEGGLVSSTHPTAFVKLTHMYIVRDLH